MANRLWAMMMGRGIVHPLDMHHSANPPSHPELLSALGQNLAASKYDIKSFLRGVCLSNTYQRSSLIPNKAIAEQLPADSFAVANMKGLSPEQLFESLLVSTQARALLEKQIDDAIAEESAATTEANAEAEKSDDDKTKEERNKHRSAKVAEFVTVFGSVPGQPEGEFAASLPQALFLANSETVSDWVPAGSGNLTERLVEMDDPAAIAEELFLSVLSRIPEAEETQLVMEQLGSSDADRPKTVAALVWSLLASAEFRLNH